MEDINALTRKVTQGSAEVLKNGEGASKEMHKLDNLAHTIMNSMIEMATGAGQINNAVTEVSEITRQNRHSIENLAGEVSKFKVN